MATVSIRGPMPSCDPPNMRGADMRNSPAALISAIVSSAMRRSPSTLAARAEMFDQTSRPANRIRYTG
jgi:hypothetical protein